MYDHAQFTPPAVQARERELLCSLHRNLRRKRVHFVWNPASLLRKVIQCVRLAGVAEMAYTPPGRAETPLIAPTNSQVAAPSVCVRQPRGPPKAAAPNESTGSLGFGERTAQLPTQDEIQSAREAVKSRRTGWRSLETPNKSTGLSSPSSPMSPSRGRSLLTSMPELNDIFGTPAGFTLKFFRDTLSDGITPSPFSWTGAGRQELEDGLDLHAFIDRWHAEETKRRERARDRAIENGTVDASDQAAPIEVLLKEQRDRFMHTRRLATEGLSNQKPCLVSRIMVYDLKAHPLFDPYASSERNINRNIGRLLKSSKKGKNDADATGDESEDAVADAVAGLSIDEATVEQVVEDQSRRINLQPLQRDPNAGAMNGEIWCHTNIEHLLPVHLQEKLAVWETHRRQIANQRLQSDHEPDMRDPSIAEESNLFGRTMYLNERGVDGAAANFGRPIPLYGPSASTHSLNQHQRGRGRESKGRDGGVVELIGWFRLNSLRLVEPESSELVRMLEIKEHAKAYKQQRQAESWCKSWQTVWARVGVERIRPKKVRSVSGAETELVDPSCIEGGPDAVELYLANLSP